MKCKKILWIFGCGLINEQCVSVRFRQMVSTTSLCRQRNNIQFMCKKSERPINSTLVSRFTDGMLSDRSILGYIDMHQAWWQMMPIIPESRRLGRRNQEFQAHSLTTHLILHDLEA